MIRPWVYSVFHPSIFPRIVEIYFVALVFGVAGGWKDSVKEDTGDGPGGMRWQVGGLRRGPLVSLCAQAQSVDLR